MNNFNSHLSLSMHTNFVAKDEINLKLTVTCTSRDLRSFNSNMEILQLSPGSEERSVSSRDVANTRNTPQAWPQIPAIHLFLQHRFLHALYEQLDVHSSMVISICMHQIPWDLFRRPSPPSYKSHAHRTNHMQLE